MSLNIKNEHTVALVRQLAALTGQSQTSAIEEAVRLRLDQLAESGRLSNVEQARRDRVDRLVGDLQAIARTCPDVTRERLDEQLYDSAGLPR